MTEMEKPERPRQKFRPYPLYNAEFERRGRLKRKLFGTLALAILIIWAAGAVYSKYHSFFESAENAQVGTLSVALTAKVSGNVDRVFVEEGQVVKAGQPLVRIGAREFQAILEARQHDLDAVAGRLEGAKQSIARLKDAGPGGDATGQELKLKWARSYSSKLLAKAQPLRERVAEAERDLQSTEVRAPSDGHIAKKSVASGKTVAVGEPLLTFVAAGLPWTTAAFKETQLAKVKVGQLAEITVIALGQTFTGRVESISQDALAGATPPAQENALGRLIKPVRLVPVKIAFDAASVRGFESRLVDGAPALVKVYVK